jgi:hypothetical protein
LRNGVEHKGDQHFLFSFTAALLFGNLANDDELVSSCVPVHDNACNRDQAGGRIQIRRQRHISPKPGQRVTYHKSGGREPFVEGSPSGSKANQSISGCKRRFVIQSKRQEPKRQAMPFAEMAIIS